MVTIEEQQQGGLRQMVFFGLAQEQFALDINKVKEIVRLPATTKLPKSPAYIAGIANLRGNVLPILDTRQRLQLHMAEHTESSRILVTEVAGHLLGLQVDSVLTVKTVDANHFKSSPSVSKNIDKDYISGVIQEDLDTSLTLILNVDEVANITVLQGDKKEVVAGSAIEQKKPEEDETAEEQQFVTFAMGREDYAFEVETVREIMRVSTITDIPNAPPHVKGLITVRDSVMPVFDLRALLGLQTENGNENERILIVETRGFTLGLIVDRVKEVRRYPAGLIQLPPDSSDVRELKGIVKVDNGKKLIMILNQDKILTEAESASVRQWMDEEGVNSMTADNRQNELGQQSGDDEVQLVTFNIGEEEYGIHITKIQEINRLDEITHLPKSPHFVEGITNLRGNVIPVLNVRKLFSLPEKESDDRTRIIIVDIGGRKTGLCVDQVDEVLRLSKNNIEPAPAIISGSDGNRFMEGVCKLEKGKRMVILLNVEQILDKQELESFRSIDTPVNLKDLSQQGPKKKAPQKKRRIAKPKVEIDE